MSSKKARTNSKKKKQETKEKTPPKDSTAALSRLLTVLVSVVVVVAAVLVKPLLDKQREQRRQQQEQDDSIINHPSEDVTTWPKPDPRFGFMVSQACLGVVRQLNVTCHPHLVMSQRHFRATKRIEPGEVLFEIPRALQLWDLDALRDPWIRLHLFEASHRQSGNRLGSEAFLAAYLALELKRKEDTTRDWRMDMLEMAYYDLLLTYSDWLDQHPLLANEEYMREQLGYSEAYGVLHGYRNMIISEYQGFSDFSKKFSQLVSREEYTAARLNVLTRAIRVGRPGPEHAIDIPFLKDHYGPEQVLHDELDSYKELLGIDLIKDGCIALIPIADMFNHHPQNNVEFEYTNTEFNIDGALVVRAANRHIEKGFEPMMSYGKGIVDAHLYARYGFVNGDGSGEAQVSLAFYHDILRLNISSQYDYLPRTGLTSRLFELIEEPVSRYLRFDDGYAECIPGSSTHPQEAELKLLQHKHLMKIANLPERWQLSVPSRNPYTYPSTTHNTPTLALPPQPISHHTKRFLDMKLPLSTCRLLSLVTSDLNGNAAQVLRDNLNNASFLLTEGNDSLEYRSWLCLRRWLGASLMSLEGDRSVRDEYDLVQQMDQSSMFGTRDWAAHHVRLGEMQSLKAVATVAGETVLERWGDVVPQTPEYNIMEEPCPQEYLSYLFDETENSKYRVEIL